MISDRLWQLLIKTYEPLSGLISKGAIDLAAVQPVTPDRLANYCIIGYSTGSALPDIFDIAISPNKETRELLVNRPQRHEILSGKQMRAGYITHVGGIFQGQEPEQSMQFQRVGVRSKELIPFGQGVNDADAIEATRLAGHDRRRGAFQSQLGGASDRSGRDPEIRQDRAPRGVLTTTPRWLVMRRPCEHHATTNP